MTTLELRDTTLVVFVDDTGHEALAEGHPVYGLGGCGALAHDLDRLIRRPWYEVRRKIGGSPDKRLHAASLRNPSEHEISALAGFFRANPFARLGATVSVETKRPADIELTRIMAGILKNRIIEIARWTPFTEVNVIFESSDRADRLIEEAFGDFQLQENGRDIQVECFFMPKAAGEPALEVADFIMHAVGRQARRRVEGRTDFAPDFAAVFHGQDSMRVSYMDVRRVEKGSPLA